TLSSSCSSSGNTQSCLLSGTFPLGTTVVTCTATDASGNSSAYSFPVTVVDTQAPTIACPANITTNTTGLCSQVVNYVTPTGSDNCSVTNVSCSPAGGSTFPVGTNTVSCIVLDGSGNSASCTF